MQFQLRVVRAGAAPSQIQLEANSPEAARLEAEQQGLTVLQVRLRQSMLGIQQLRRAGKAFPLILFCQEFRVLFEAGLSVMDVLQTLIDKEPHTQTKLALQQLLSHVQEGKTLSQAMAMQAENFPSLFVATIAAAETTGDLPEALLRYHHYLAQFDLLKKRIISASIYPAIVVSFGLLVLAFLLIYVIPKFSKIYETQVANVSTSTKLLLSIGQFSQHYRGFILLAAVLVIVVAMLIFTQTNARAWCYQAFSKLPWVGNKIHVYHLTRFYRTFAMLLKSGIPVMSGLHMFDRLLGAGLQKNLQQAKQQISEGKVFSQALMAANLTTPVALRLFSVGEKTGTLDTMMERAASFHEEQMMRWVDRFTKVFEPAIMALIGLLIGGIVLMMYMPIFELASGIQ